MTTWLALPTRLIKWVQSKARHQFGFEDFVAQPGIRDLGQNRFAAETEDPSFYLGITLEPGDYAVSLQACVAHIDTHGVHATAQFFVDDGHGESEAQSWLLPFQSNVPTIGRMSIKHRARLRFDPIEHSGAFEIVHLHIKRLKAGAPGNTPIPDLARPACRLHTGITPYAHWLAMGQTTQTDSAERPLPTWAVAVFVIDDQADLTLVDRSVASVRAQDLCPIELHLLSPQAQSATRTEDAPQGDMLCLSHRVENGDWTNAIKDALHATRAKGVLMLMAGDTLPKNALHYFVNAAESHPRAPLFYGDQDFCDAHGFRCNPYFKPDWSPDLFEGYNYLGRAVVLNKAAISPDDHWTTPADAAGWHTLLARLTQSDHPPVHVPSIVYHQTAPDAAHPTASAWAQAVGSDLALSEAPDQHKDQAILGSDSRPWPLVSIIIPTRDGRDLLSRCIESLGSITRYPHMELIVVDNGSTCSETLQLLDKIGQDALGVPALTSQLIGYPAAFNYSAINNLAVRHAQGEVLVFLNDDIEITHAEWLTEMVKQALKPGIGCVGAQLHFPNRLVQHAGIVLGMGGVAGHIHRGDPSACPGYFLRLSKIHNTSAVTGAAMAVCKGRFEALGGFDEGALAVAFNDVDLCLKAMASGLRNMTIPDAILIHHESATRGADTQPIKRKRLEAEEQTMQERWGPLIARDPYFNPNLSLRREDVQLTEDGQAR